jgi:cytosine/adenosine deaminase-related metal-dependent hydrolase
VHCPRSHDYFRHQPFPAGDLSAAGVNLCLGTDSLVTVRIPRRQPVSLDLGAEMRAFADAHPGVAPDQIVRMVTVNPARALGLRHRAGELAAGAWADLIALPFAGPIRQAWDAVVQHRGDVSASMIEGRWVIPPSSR